MPSSASAGIRQISSQLSGEGSKRLLGKVIRILDNQSTKSAANHRRTHSADSIIDISARNSSSSELSVESFDAMSPTIKKTLSTVNNYLSPTPTGSAVDSSRGIGFTSTFDRSASAKRFKPFEPLKDAIHHQHQANSFVQATSIQQKQNWIDKMVYKTVRSLYKEFLSRLAVFWFGGALLGTPAYMLLKQIEEETANERMLALSTMPKDEKDNDRMIIRQKELEVEKIIEKSAEEVQIIMVKYLNEIRKSYQNCIKNGLANVLHNFPGIEKVYQTVKFNDDLSAVQIKNNFKKAVQQTIFNTNQGFWKQFIREYGQILQQEKLRAEKAHIVIEIMPKKENIMTIKNRTTQY